MAAEERRRLIGPLVCAAALLFVVDVLAFGRHGVWLIAGTVIGLVAIRRFDRLTPGPRPTKTLRRTLAPVLLPLLVVLVVGTNEQSWLLQLAAAALMVALSWRFIVAADLARRKVRLAWKLELVALTVMLALPALGLGALAWTAALDDSGLHGRGDLAGALFTTALLVWLAGIVLRLVGFSTSWWRAGVSVLALVTLYLGLRMLGIVPGAADWPSVTPLEVAAGLTVLALIAAAVIHRRGNPRGAVPESVATRAASLGLGCTLLASVAIGAAALIGLVKTSDPSSDRGRPALQPFEAAPVEGHPIGFTAKDRALAQRFSPVLALTNHERWSPIRVEDYLPRVRLTGSDRDILAPAISDLPTGCRADEERPCYRLTIDNCRDGDTTCAPDEPHGSGSPERTGAEYVRSKRISPPVLLPRPYRLSPLVNVLQYWFFYTYDRWHQHVLSGTLTQQHQGDWETVSVGVDAHDEPLFVAYSAHCAGTVWPWGRRTPLAVDDHPLVAVAEGSQANYPRADQEHAPDWIGCRNNPKGVLTLVSYASNVRDKTEYGRLWYPEALIAVDENTRPMSFAGFWGGDDRLDIQFKETRSAHLGDSPKSPPLQGRIWSNPVSAFFCSAYKGAGCPGGRHPRPVSSGP